MIENFVEYMWYLFTSPYKKIKKDLNKWYILCRVFGRRFDEIKEDILRARDEGMVATCSHEMLPVHGADRKLSRYEGEMAENFRSRIAMHEEVCRLGGTDEGMILAIRALGFLEVEKKTIKEMCGDSERWAEFCIIFTADLGSEYPIGLKILRKEVRKIKEVGAKDNYLVRLRGEMHLEDTAQFIRGIVIMKIRWYHNALWNGTIQWNGQEQWSSRETNHPLRVISKIKQEMALSSVAELTQRYHYWTWNGEYRWNGQKNWDAEIKKEVI